MKIVFLGSGGFAVPILERLHETARSGDLVFVISRPPTRRGRGRRVQPTEVAERAEALGLKCDTPASANDTAYLDDLEKLNADLFIVADYGELLRRRIRELPRIGIFNLHGSLLPRYRGAAPVAHAILNGEIRTGVTLFRIERGLDSGPIVDTAGLEIAADETAGELEARLAVLAADLLARNLPRFADGSFTESPQDESLATVAPKLRKKDGEIDWCASAERIERMARAYQPWPGAYSHLYDSRAPQRTTFRRLRPVTPQLGDGENEISADLKPGYVWIPDGKTLNIVCGSGIVRVDEIQRAGKPPMSAAAYLNGQRLKSGDYFFSPPASSNSRENSLPT